ncbi:hypothetical protein CRYUN_Cryun26dG0023800 [Craigia yunnanensis]
MDLLREIEQIGDETRSDSEEEEDCNSKERDNPEGRDAETWVNAVKGLISFWERVTQAREKSDIHSGEGDMYLFLLIKNGDKSLPGGLFLLELLTAVERRSVNWNLLTKSESGEDKRLNATYIISMT